MSRSAVAVWVLVALALAVAAYFTLGRGRTGPAAGGAGGAGGAALPFSPAEVAWVEVTPPGGAPARVGRSTLFGGWALWPPGEPEVAAWPVKASSVQGALRLLGDLRTSSAAPGAGEDAGTVRLTLTSGAAWEVRFVGAGVAGVQRALVAGPGGGGTAAECDAGVAAALLRPGPAAWREDLAFPGLGPDLESIGLSGERGQGGERVGVRLDRGAGGWVVSEPVPAPADAAAVAELVRRLAAVTLAGAPQRTGGAGGADAPDPGGGAVRVREVRRGVGGPLALERTLEFRGRAGFTGERLEGELRVSARAGDAAEHLWRVEVERESVEGIATVPEAYIARVAWSGDPGAVGALEFTPRGADAPTLRVRRDLSGWTREGEASPLAGAEQAHAAAIVALLAESRADRVEIIGEEAGAEGLRVRVLSLGGDPLAEAALEVGRDGVSVTVVTGRVRRTYAGGGEAAAWAVHAAAAAGSGAGSGGGGEPGP